MAHVEGGGTEDEGTDHQSVRKFDENRHRKFVGTIGKLSVVQRQEILSRSVCPVVGRMDRQDPRRNEEMPR